MHPGRGPGLTSKRLGQRGGTETVTLSEAQMPSHTHSLEASGEDADAITPENDYLGNDVTIYGPASSLVAMAAEAHPNAGGSQPHNNLQPYLTMNFIIALQGLYLISELGIWSGNPNIMEF